MLDLFYAASSRSPSFARVATLSDNQTKVIDGGRGLTLHIDTGRHPRD